MQVGLFKLIMACTLAWVEVARAEDLPSDWDQAILDHPTQFVQELHEEFVRQRQGTTPQQWYKAFWKWQKAEWWKNVDNETKPVDNTMFEDAILAAREARELETYWDLQRLQALNWPRGSPEDRIKLAHRLDVLRNEPAVMQVPEVWTLTMLNYAELNSEPGSYPLRDRIYHELFQKWDKQDSVLPLYLRMDITELRADVLYEEDMSEKALQFDLENAARCTRFQWVSRCVDVFAYVAQSYLKIPAQDERRKASKYIEEAEKLALKSQDQDALAYVHYVKIKYSLAAGDAKEAELHAKKISLLLQAKPHVRVLIDARTILAEYFHEKGDLSKAWYYLEPTLRDRKSLKSKTLELAYLIHKGLGHATDALSFLERFREAEKTEQNNRNLADYERLKVEVGLASEESRSKDLQVELQAKQQLERTLFALLLVSLSMLGLGAAFLRQLIKEHRSKRKLDLMMQTIQLGLVSFDSKLAVDGVVSRFFCDIIGREIAIGDKHCWDELALKSSQTAAWVEVSKQIRLCFGRSSAVWQALEHSLPQTFELKHEGKSRRFHLRWQPLLRRRNEVVGVLLILRDVTDEEALREDLEQRNERLINLGVMTATIAHDIASPAQVIDLGQRKLGEEIQNLRAILEPIFRDQSDEEARIVWDALSRSLAESLLLLQRIAIAIARIVRIQAAIRKQSRQDDLPEFFNLKNLIEESLLLASPYLRDLKVDIKCPDHLDAYAVRSQLGQVLTNLFNNAADALEEEGVKASGDTLQLSVEVVVSTQVLSIIIEDAGPGIPKQSQQKIFDNFYTTKPTGKGTGLGLPICRRIMKEHGGNIQLGSNSQLGGAQFILTIPHDFPSSQGHTTRVAC